MAMEQQRRWAGAARRWRMQSSAPQPPPAPAADRDSLHWRNVRVVAVARLLAANQLAYPREIVAKALFVSVMMFIITSLWRAVGEHHDVLVMTGMTVPQLIWYLAFTEAMYMSFTPIPDGLAVDREVRSGDITYRLARPMGYATYHVAAHLGERSVTFALKLVTTAAVALVLVGLPPLPGL